MNEMHIKIMAHIMIQAFMNNVEQEILSDSEESAASFSAGFADGCSWALMRLEAMGVKLPAGSELFFTDTTKGLTP